MTNESTTSADAAPAHVEYSFSDGIAVLQLDDGKANALGHALLAGFEHGLDRAEADDASVVLVVGREGKFSAGFDLKVMTSGPAAARDMLGRGAELGLRLYAFPVPVVFAVTGHALAMGGILLACADIRIGAAGPFKIGLPEVRIGMPVPEFATELCRDRLSPRWYTRAVQLGESLSPEQALDAGFFDELLDPAEVVDRARAVSAELAEAIGRGPFRQTRGTIRSDLVDRLRVVLAEDLAAFNVE